MARKRKKFSGLNDESLQTFIDLTGRGLGVEKSAALMDTHINNSTIMHDMAHAHFMRKAKERQREEEQSTKDVDAFELFRGGMARSLGE